MKNIFLILFALSFSSLVAQNISVITTPRVSEINTSGITLSWTTDNEGSTEAYWGNTVNLEQTAIKESGLNTIHSLSISGQSASSIIYVKPFSVSGTDTAYANTQMHITASESTGNIKVYFVSSVDNSLAISENAIQVENAIADTLINYINRAKYSVDVAIYNMDTYDNSKIATALNNAFNRGVTVRVVYNESTSNTGIAQLNSGIGKIESPSSSSYGIMHNKFVVIDANSADANDAIVWTGSTNFTSGQLNTDANNVIIIQDKSLALTYTIEFNEMFGSEGNLPNANEAKFGPDKKDNTPHEFLIDGIRIESYFSPSDPINEKIIEVVNSADNELHIATMLITREDIAKVIRERNNLGVDTKLILDDIDQYTQDDILVTALGSDFRTMGETGIMHHKYMIVDHLTNDSDPAVLTGCHNWSTSAKDRNDENTLIIHDQNIANLYYQEFSNRFENGEILAEQSVCNPDSAEITPEQTTVEINILSNDYYAGDIVVSITEDTDWGIVNLNSNNTLSYRPKVGFEKGIDTIKYSVCSQYYTSLCDETFVKIDVDLIGETAIQKTNTFITEVFPSTSNGDFTIVGEFNTLKISAINAQGKIVLQNEVHKDGKEPIIVNLSDQANGIYYLLMIDEKGQYSTKTIIINK